MNNQTQKPKVSMTIMALLVLAIIASSAYVFYQQQQKHAKAEKILHQPGVFVAFPEGKKLSKVQLQMATPEGVKAVTSDAFKHKWHLIYFGYTFCPDVCPTELTTLNRVYEDLKQQLPADKLPEVVFISVDPERDMPQNAMKYVKFFNQDFIGLTGKQTELRLMANPFGIDWHKEKNTAVHGGTDEKNYLVSHSTTILLVDPNNQVVGMFPAPHDPKKMVNVIKVLIND